MRTKFNIYVLIITISSKSILLPTWRYATINHSIRYTFVLLLTEEFEDTKGVIRIRKSKKDRQHYDKKKKSTNGQTTIYKTYT